MTTRLTCPFRDPRLSLADLVGSRYLEAVCAARSALTGQSELDLRSRAQQPLDWYPDSFHHHQLSLLPRVGKPVCAGLQQSSSGATSRAFDAASQSAMSPLSASGFYRVGESGRLFLTTKSEHYHTPLGHGFPGYALLDIARQLGIPNATHNNTRGHIVRRLENELVAAAHGLGAGHGDRLPDRLRDNGSLEGLNRVLNLETGSLAVEAALKLMLAPFYATEDGQPPPPHHGLVPVFLVMGDDDGGLRANYHGTTVLAQTLRGMWPELQARFAAQNLMQVCAIRPDMTADVDAAFTRYMQPPYRIAGFLHEIVMMNYGARLLAPTFLQHAYARCAQSGVPTLVDEIQSCLWAPGLFLFREYGLRPSCVAIGKGFPGGEYPASRLIFSAALDSLPQFGALVTNGQEELASLAYLITMRWAQENADVIRHLGDQYEARVRTLATGNPDVIAGVSGRRHLLGLEFHDLAAAKQFTGTLNRAGLDISAQTYKANCPPVALTKLPLTACETVLDFVLERLQNAIVTVRNEA